MPFPACVGGFVGEIVGLNGLPIQALSSCAHELSIVGWGPGSRGGSDWERCGLWHLLLVVLKGLDGSASGVWGKIGL